MGRDDLANHAELAKRMVQLRIVDGGDGVGKGCGVDDWAGAAYHDLSFPLIAPPGMPGVVV